MNEQYFCAECRQPCEVRLWESGAGSACHESALMVRDFSYSRRDRYRPLTPDEQEALTTTLAEELHAERSPAQRAKARVAEGE